MSDTPTVQFNINHYIRVKFSAASLHLWKEHAQHMRDGFPKMVHLWPLEPPTDGSGYYRGQFWSIMHLVAPELAAGHSVFEDCLIEFEAAEYTREIERRREAEARIEEIEGVKTQLAEQLAASSVALEHADIALRAATETIRALRAQVDRQERSPE